MRIARYLSESPARENRLRSTLAHEYGHVVFHGFLWALDIGGRKPGTRRTQYRRCRRSRVIASPQSDWMEWQAGYAGGAILMPVTPVRDLVATAFAEWDAGPRVELESDHHADLIGRVAAMFRRVEGRGGLPPPEARLHQDPNRLVGSCKGVCRGA